MFDPSDLGYRLVLQCLDGRRKGRQATLRDAFAFHAQLKSLDFVGEHHARPANAFGVHVDVQILINWAKLHGW